MVATPPFFPSAGRGTVQFWGEARGPTVFLWDGLDEEGRELCADVIHTRKDWVVWSRARPIKGDRTPREFEQAGKTFFWGKAKCNMKEQGGQEAEEEIEEEGSDNEVNVGGRARRQRGWWQRGDIETKLNTVNMTAWVHEECDIMDDDAFFRLQTAWNNPQQKDECSVCLNDLERVYWQGTEVGRMGGYEFQGATFGVDESCKDCKMGAGCCRFQGAAVDKCTRVGREEEGTSSNRPELGVSCWHYKRKTLVRMSFYCVTTKRYCVSLRNG